MLSEGLYALLSGAAEITDIVGTSDSRADGTTGVFPVQMPEQTPLPAIVITQIAGDGLDSLDGGNVYQTARVQFSCYGKSFIDAKRLAAAVKRFFRALSTPYGLRDGTQLCRVGLVLEADGFDEAPFIYHAPIDFEMSYLDTGS